MKAAIITRYFYPVKGGIENHCFNLAKYLAKNNYYITVYTSNKTPDGRNLAKKSEIISGFRVVRLNNFWKFVPDFKKFDVIHLHNFTIFPHFWILLKTIFYKLLNRKRPKIIITLHGGFIPQWLEYTILARLIKKLYHKTFGKFLLNFATDIVIAVSKWEEEQLIKENIRKKKIVFIPNGVEEAAYNLPKLDDKGLEKYKPYLLFIGRVNRRKRLDFIIKCLSELRHNVNLLIIGPIQDKHYFLDIKTLLEKLNMKNKVMFIGEVSVEEKYRYIDNALAVVLISNHEAEGISIKEAIVRGKPVIVNNRTALPYIVKNKLNGFVISNKKQFIEAVNALLTDNFLIKSIEVYNMRISRNWRWRNVINKIIKCYKLCV